MAQNPPWEPTEHEWAIIDRLRVADAPSDVIEISQLLLASVSEDRISTEAAKLLNRVSGKLLKDMEDRLRYGSPQRKDRDRYPDPCDLLPKRTEPTRE